jgi:hypothetical protein
MSIKYIGRKEGKRDRGFLTVWVYTLINDSEVQECTVGALGWCRMITRREHVPTPAA